MRYNEYLELKGVKKRTKKIVAISQSVLIILVFWVACVIINAYHMKGAEGWNIGVFLKYRLQFIVLLWLDCSCSAHLDLCWR